MSLHIVLSANTRTHSWRYYDVTVGFLIYFLLIMAQRLRKKITFDEWKERKDRELRKEKEMKIISEMMDGSGERMAEKRVITSTNEIVKKVNDAIRDMQTKDQVIAKLNACKRDPSKADDYIVKETGKLTFREWLHNKTLMEREKMKREYEEEIESERKKKEREEEVKKAYNVWLIKSKYRSLQNYYPHLGEDKIREILLEDVTRLPLISTKEVGVGDDTIDRMLGTMIS